MRIVTLCFSSRGEATALRLAGEGDVVRVAPGKLKTTVASWWGRVDALVFVSSLGTAVRAAAPHLSDKGGNPAVVVVSEDGGIVLPVTGSRLEAVDELADRLAETLGASLVRTTSTDRSDLTAPDLLASRLGWTLLGRELLPDLNGMLMESGTISYWTDSEEYLPPLPEEYSAADEPFANLVISPRRYKKTPAKVQLVPKCVVAGVDCRRGVPLGTIRSVLYEAMRSHSFLPEALKEIRTVGEKSDEPGLTELALSLKIPLTVVPPDEMERSKDSLSQSAAKRNIDLQGAAESCAASAGRLLGERLAVEGVTVALAMSTPDRDAQLP